MKKCNFNIKKANGDDYRTSKGASLGMCDENTLIFADLNKDKTKVYISEWDIKNLKTYEDGHRYGTVSRAWHAPDGEIFISYYSVWVKAIDDSTPAEPPKEEKAEAKPKRKRAKAKAENDEAPF